MMPSMHTRCLLVHTITNPTVLFEHMRTHCLLVHKVGYIAFHHARYTHATHSLQSYGFV